jgi:DNA-binding beta-propeller fold protein YncE
MIHLSTTSKLMCAGIALSLGWILLEACECDEANQIPFLDYWVTCEGNKPTLMVYLGDFPIDVYDPLDIFDVSDYDCSSPGSPPRPKSSAATSPVGGPSGPGGYARPHAAGSSQSAYLPQRLRDLPFTPNVPVPGSPPVCDSTYSDVLQTDHVEALVTRISTCPFKVVRTYPVATRPLQVEITPDGSTALVTSFDNAVNFINLSTNQVTQLTTDINVNPDGIAITPDGTTAYVTSFTTFNPVILVINIPTKTIVTSFPTIAYAQGATLTPDGSQLWITSPLGSETDVIDTLTNTTIFRLNIPASTGVAFNSTGTTAYVTSGANQVVAVNTATFQTVKTYTVGQGPTDIQMSYGDQFLVVNNNIAGSVSVIDLVKNAVKTLTLAGNSAPTGISFVH